MEASSAEAAAAHGAPPPKLFQQQGSSSISIDIDSGKPNCRTCRSSNRCYSSRCRSRRPRQQHRRRLRPTPLRGRDNSLGGLRLDDRDNRGALRLVGRDNQGGQRLVGWDDPRWDEWDVPQNDGRGRHHAFVPRACRHPGSLRHPGSHHRLHRGAQRPRRERSQRIRRPGQPERSEFCVAWCTSLQWVPTLCVRSDGVRCRRAYVKTVAGHQSRFGDAFKIAWVRDRQRGASVRMRTSSKGAPRVLVDIDQVTRPERVIGGLVFTLGWRSFWSAAPNCSRATT